MDTLLHLSSVRPGDGGMSIVHRPVRFPAHYLVKRRGPAREAVKGHSDKKSAATGEDAEKNVFVTVANAAGCNRYTDGQQPYPYFPGTVHFSDSYDTETDGIRSLIGFGSLVGLFNLNGPHEHL
jgi:hypothetical protein